MTAPAVSRQGTSSRDPWVVYLLRCADGTLYTGIARDVVARVAMHNAGRGARYTCSRLPVQLVYMEAAEDRSAALRREYQIKQLKVADKHCLIQKAQVMAAGSPRCVDA